MCWRLLLEKPWLEVWQSIKSRLSFYFGFSLVALFEGGLKGRCIISQTLAITKSSSLVIKVSVLLKYWSAFWAMTIAFPSGSVDEGVSEGLPSIQGASNTGRHTEDDERYYNLFQLLIAVSYTLKKCMLTLAFSPGVNSLVDCSNFKPSIHHLFFIHASPVCTMQLP